jgi:predicted nucleic acid-binding Zn ribbon protein
MAAVTARWEEVVGPNVARHVTVVSFGDDGVLTLQASSSSWEAQIKALSPPCTRG